MAKVVRSPEDLGEQLRIQLEMLGGACERFDGGSVYEAQNIARIIRLLVHKTRRSHPLLEHAGAMPSKWMDTAIPDDPSSPMSYFGLISIELGPAGSQFRADLDGRDPIRWIDFEVWWRIPVVSIRGGASHSREDIVLTVADQDGGAHVDPGVDSEYFELSRRNALQLFSGTADEGLSPMAHPHLVLIRQIGHEVLRSLIADYRCMPKDSASFVISGGTIEMKALTDLTDIQKLSLRNRNGPCPCGTGKRLKHCCGRLTGFSGSSS